MNVNDPSVDISKIKRFNVRVYGILLWQEQLLVLDEQTAIGPITKLPGGGVEFGEGTRESLIREFKEETGQDIEVRDHFYTLDYFQPSIFDAADHLLTVYYYVHHANPESIPVKMIQNDFDDRLPEPNMNLRWVSFGELLENTMTLSIDKKVVAKLLKSLNTI